MNTEPIKKHLSSIGTEVNDTRFEMMDSEPNTEKMWSHMAKVIAMAQQVQILLGFKPLSPALPQDQPVPVYKEVWVVDPANGGRNKREHHAIRDIKDYVKKNPTAEPSKLHSYCKSRIEYWRGYKYLNQSHEKGSMSLSAEYDFNNATQVLILSGERTLILTIHKKEVAS